ncbi:MAG TPA: uroporphyrinogen-III synthase, partial [Acidimicrobiales bacterium]|nr:uroporphyrinogen-III synthase [Acidimicrobiales bacterium]
RGLVTSFTVVAGHSRSVDAPPSEGGTNWEALAATGGTIVVLMGTAHRGRIAERLIAGGLSPATPVLAVQWGTEPNQLQVRTTLGELGTVPLGPPATIVIGQVAALQLAPAVLRPLSGRTVTVTRAAHQALDISKGLRELGARALEVPTIEIAPPSDGGAALQTAARELGRGRYSWVVFSSANAVERFFACVPDARWLGRALVAAVGPATAEALLRVRVVADLVPSDHRAEGLVAAFPAASDAEGNSGERRGAVLLPQAAAARLALRLGLEGLGWQVDVVDAYRTLPLRVRPELLARAAQADAICFASPSALDSYLDQAQEVGASTPPAVICIGPVTAAAAVRRGLPVTAQAAEHTVEGLLATIAEVLAPASPPERAKHA